MKKRRPRLEPGAASAFHATFILSPGLLLRRGCGDFRAVARRVGQAAIDEHAHLCAAVLRAPLARRVVGHRVQSAVAERRQDAPERDVVVLYEIAHDRLRALLAELAVDVL